MNCMICSNVYGRLDTILESKAHTLEKDVKEGFDKKDMPHLGIVHVCNTPKVMDCNGLHEIAISTPCSTLRRNTWENQVLHSKKWQEIYLYWSCVMDTLTQSVACFQLHCKKTSCIICYLWELG